MLASMRVGGRCHCIIPPALGFGVEQGVRYDAPLPPEAAERQRLIAWLGPHFVDEDKWKQVAELMCELRSKHVIQLRRVEFCSKAFHRIKACRVPR